MIRKAKLEDLQAILTLYQQLFPNEDYSEIGDFTHTWSEILNDNKIKCFLLFKNEMALASCIVTIIPNLTRNQRPYAVIENVITHCEYRKMGLGREIMDKAVQCAKEQNCYKVMLLSSSKRMEAHKFYERIGFDGDSKKGFQIRFLAQNSILH